MEPTRRDYDADLLTVVYAWADNDATADQLLGAVVLHQQAIASLQSAPTPHRSPERIGLERGEVGVSAPDTRRACWTCRWAPTLDRCAVPGSAATPDLHDWIWDNIGDNLHPIPTARDCPGYEDKP